MAIHPNFPSPADARGNLSPQQARAISAWTEQAAASLESLTLSEPLPTNGRNAPQEPTPLRESLRGASIGLSIPLDDPVATIDGNLGSRVKILGQFPNETKQMPTVAFRRREPLRRDSLKRREALLKGKDGSRRRQRWENDRLLNNPWAEPPSSKDWHPQPTYTRHEHMPYYLASLWDSHYAHLDRRSPRQKANDMQNEKHRVPKDLRAKLKHARAARGMLQDLEEDIRQFIQKWNESQLSRHNGLADVPSPSDDDSEDEVVFVGRNGQLHGSSEHTDNMGKMLDVTKSSRNRRDGEKMVFESLVDDGAAGFGRWLVHSVASYYGLHTWSVTVGEPARREAYVGFFPPTPGSRPGLLSHIQIGCRSEAMIQPGDELPRPLWTQV